MKEILEAIAKGYAILIQPHHDGVSVRLFEGNDLLGVQYGRTCRADEEHLGLVLSHMPRLWDQKPSGERGTQPPR